MWGKSNGIAIVGKYSTLLQIVEKGIIQRRCTHSGPHSKGLADAMLIASEEKDIDWMFWKTVVLLHDSQGKEDTDKKGKNPPCAAGSGNCRRILKQMQYPRNNQESAALYPERIASVAQREPVSIEAKILYDADKVDSMEESGWPGLHDCRGITRAYIRCSCLTNIPRKNIVRRQS